MARTASSKLESSNSTATIGFEAPSLSLRIRQSAFRISSAWAHHFIDQIVPQSILRGSAFQQREASQQVLSEVKYCKGAFHRLNALLFNQAEANRHQSRTLATLRDTLLPKLLPKLLSGELSVQGNIN